MDHAAMLALFDREQRVKVQYPDIRREARPHLVRHVHLAGRDGFVAYSRLRPEEVDAVISEQVAYFQSLGQGFEWKVYDHDTPADLRERLAARGFLAEEPEAVLVLNLQEAPPALLAPPAADVRRVTDRAGIADILAVKAAVWGEDFTWLGDELTQQIEGSPEAVSLYVAYADGQPCSTARICFHPGSQFASLWGGSTLSAFRRRGLYTALLAVRAQEALRRGCRFLTVDASPMSRPILQRHGFQWLTNAQAYTWPARRSGNPAPAGNVS
ncbi:MAG: GNAT family N-acetyltransferase [Chloroflexi bacterium]|nr:GNAT family N-acetyltransferase [Chloroflexota bacterium]